MDENPSKKSVCACMCVCVGGGGAAKAEGVSTLGGWGHAPHAENVLNLKPVRAAEMQSNLRVAV